jgi:hypothetical protein
MREADLVVGEFIDVVDASYKRLSDAIKADYRHLSALEQQALAVFCCYTHPQHRDLHVAPTPQPATSVVSEPALQTAVPKKSRKGEILRWLWAIAVLILLLVIAVKAHAQVSPPAKPASQIFTIQWQHNDNSLLKSFAGPVKIKEGTNITFSLGSCPGADCNKVLLNASSTASTAWSAITSGTNSNLGTFAMSGNTLDLSAATMVKLRVAGGLTTSANGDLGYDSTGNRWHLWVNGLDRKLIGATNDGGAGQPCLSNADGTCTFADPITSGNQGAATTQTITATGALTGVTVTNIGTVLVTVSGTYAGVAFNFEGTPDGTFTPAFLLNASQLDAASIVTATGTLPSNTTRAWLVDAAGMTKIRLNATAWTSGTANVTLTPVYHQFIPWTHIDAAALPLPAGASTAAKQPALGTAGSPSADVLSVQGVASGTPVPMSAASLPLPTGAATNAAQTDGTQKAIVRGGQKGATNTNADITHTAEGADHEAVDVQIYHSGVAKDPTAIRALASGTDSVTDTQGTAAATTAPWPVNHGTVARTTAAWTSATALDTALSLATGGYSTAIVTLDPTTTFTGGTLNFEVSDDGGTKWYVISAARIDTYTSESTYAIVASTKRAWEVDVAAYTNFRVRLNPAITGTGTANLGVSAIAAASEPNVAVGQATASLLNETATQGPANTAANGWPVKPTDGTNNQGYTASSEAKINCASGAACPVNATLQAGSAVAGKFGVDQTSDNNGVEMAPTTSAAAGITPVVSAAAESSHVLKASAGNLYSVYVTTGATAGYLMVFNATSAPADGAVTPIECAAVPASSTTSVSYLPGPMGVFSTGITAVFSTTGCFTKTASATAFFHGLIK